MVETIAPHQTLQYESSRHQAGTAVAGMWLFLASELLFFAALLFAFAALRHQHREGFALAAGHTNLVLGGVNTAMLVTSSLVLTLGSLRAEQGDRRRLLQAIGVTAALGVAFLGLKGVEWYMDFDEGLWPGPHFALAGTADGGGAALFYTLYFLGTGLHGVHMLVGLGLLAVLAWRAGTGEFDRPAPGRAAWTTPVEVAGLYWSFVDMVWLLLFPTIYLFGRLA